MKRIIVMQEVGFIAAWEKKTSWKISSNPFAPSAVISFTHAKAEYVSIKIYDEGRKLIRVLADEIMHEGMHQFVWNANDDDPVASGASVYFAKMQAGNLSQTQKLLVK